DFEYYREKIGSENTTRTMHHFVNGGGGAYLSIGTALDFPEQPPVGDWAFYPSADRLRTKMEAEMPIWKQPFWYWIKWLNAWPFSVEALSGVFDFNDAPIFQSFMEVMEDERREPDMPNNRRERRPMSSAVGPTCLCCAQAEQFEVVGRIRL